MNPFATTIATIAIIALSAFFVAAEFSLINARTLTGCLQGGGCAR